MFIYNIGDAQKIASLFALMLILCLLIGFIVPRRRKKDKRIVNFKAFVYETLAGIGAVAIGTECFLKLFGWLSWYFTKLNSGTSESTAWAPIEAIIVIVMITFLADLLLMWFFELGKKLKLKVLHSRYLRKGTDLAR